MKIKAFLFLSIILMISLAGCQKTSSNVDVTPLKETPRDITYLKSNNLITEKCSIEGMTCTSCSFGAEAALKELDGVQDAKISYEEGGGEITYDPSKVTREELINAVLPMTLIFDQE